MRERSPIVSDRAQLQALVSAGLSDQAIADQVGCSSRTVLRWRGHYRIASQWTPPEVSHGNPSRYQAGCPCDECRIAWCARQSADSKARNRASAATATRSWEPWTADEDAVVLAHTPAEAVLLLGRTWSACATRRGKLRALEAATA